MLNDKTIARLFVLFYILITVKKTAAAEHLVFWTDMQL